MISFIVYGLSRFIGQTDNCLLNIYTLIISSKYAYNMLVPPYISVEQVMQQLSVNFRSETPKFLFIVETSNMPRYVVNVGFPEKFRLLSKHS